MEFNVKFAGLPVLVWIPLLPLIGAFLNLTLGRRLSRGAVHTIAIASVVAACGLSLYMVFGPLFTEYKNGNPLGTVIEQNVYTWIEVGQFKVPLALRLDTLSAVMILIITFVGSLIHIYSTGYMAHEPRYAAYFGYLNLFTGAMLILVLASNMPVMFIGWEGVGLCSFLLIGFWYEKDEYATAGRKAFVVNRIGDFAFLLGMFLLFWATKDISGDQLAAAASNVQFPTTFDATAKAQAIESFKNVLVERGSLDFANLGNPAMGKLYVDNFWGSERLAAAAGILLFIGACGKSAQLPLYVWLPDAMAGPTPVSALIHAATMVTAGVYMVCRMSFLYSASTTAMIVVATVGLLTALVAAFMAFAQTDMKKVLAYSTVSQLGFMFVAAGTGAWVAAIFHLMTHAFFKACLFLGAGSVMHGMEHGGSTTPGDITKMGGLRKHMKVTHATFLISCLAIAGFPLTAGFFSKDEILAGAFNVHPPGWPVWYGKILWGGLIIAALGTAFYMWRLYFLVFGGDERTEEAKHAHESPPSMTGPLAILAVFAALIGFIGMPHFKWVPSFGHALESWVSRSVVSNFYDPSTNSPEIAGHASDSTTWILLLVASAVGILGIGLAYALYGKGPSKTVDNLVEGPLQPAYEASKNKLWVDEIYESTIIRPFRVVARGLFEIVDRFVIDTVAVTGVAFVVGLFSRISRWFQNGQVQRYLSGLVVGAALVFVITDCKTKNTFEFERKGDLLELRASSGAGVAGKASKLAWDITGDGIADMHPDTGRPLEGATVTVRAADVTSSNVTLIVEDAVTRKTTKVTREVAVIAPTAEAPEGGAK
ncbi:MAG: NADH-quinone oxidoreductase subunit L [Deltaproteobacteria bacterium]|nr:NADH-quinone oxidoreductase subunit L [Deltaproteobacteria bacterium]